MSQIIFRISLMFVFVLALQDTLVMAQGIGVAVGQGGVQLTGFGDVDLDKTVEHWAKAQRFEIGSKMNLRVTQVVKICELNESEAKKLKIAAKGIVGKRISAGQHQIEVFSKKSGLVVKAPDVPDEAEVSEQDKLRIYGANPLGNGVVELKTYFEKPISSHPFWAKTLERTLTAEQMDKYKKFRRSTNLRLFYSATEVWLSKLDSEIFLSPQQHKNILALVRKKGEELVNDSQPETFSQASDLVKKHFGKKPEMFSDQLSKPQLERFKASLNPQRGSRVSWGAAPKR